MPIMIPLNAGEDKYGVASIRGNLDQVHVAKLLFGFFKARKTGTLVFNDGFDDLVVYLFKGCPVLYVQGLYEQDDFAQYLSRFGLIAPEELEKFRKKAEQEKTTALRLLLDQRILDEAMVRRLAERFFEINALGLFSWRRGEYRFYEKPRLPGFDGEPDPLRSLRRVIDGIRQRYHAGMIEARLEKRLHSPLKLHDQAPLPLGELLVADDERQIAAWIEDGATLAEIIATSALKPNDSRALVFALLTLECVKFEAKGKPKRARAEDSSPAGSILGRLFRQAEASVERIQRQVKQEEATQRQFIKTLDAEHIEVHGLFPDEEPEHPVVEDETAMLRRRLQEKIQELQSTVAALETVAGGRSLSAPEAKPAPPAPPAPPKERSLADLLNESIDAAEATGDPATAMVGGEEVEFDENEFAVSEQTLAVEGDSDGWEPETRSESAAPLVDFDAVEPMPPAEPSESEAAPAFDELADLPESEAPGEADFSEHDPPVRIFQMAMALLDQEEWSRAYRALSIALEHGYDTPEAAVYHGWAFYQAHPDDPDRFIQAATIVQEGIDQNPAKPHGFVVLGKMYYAEGDRSMAELYFVKALEVDHDCREAKEFIRRIYQER